MAVIRTLREYAGSYTILRNGSRIGMVSRDTNGVWVAEGDDTSVSASTLSRARELLVHTLFPDDAPEARVKPEEIPEETLRVTEDAEYGRADFRVVEEPSISVKIADGSLVLTPNQALLDLLPRPVVPASPVKEVDREPTKTAQETPVSGRRPDIFEFPVFQHRSSNKSVSAHQHKRKAYRAEVITRLQGLSQSCVGKTPAELLDMAERRYPSQKFGFDLCVILDYLPTEEVRGFLLRHGMVSAPVLRRYETKRELLWLIGFYGWGHTTTICSYLICDKIRAPAVVKGHVRKILSVDRNMSLAEIAKTLVEKGVLFRASSLWGYVKGARADLENS
jgi:hypothetical protein